MGIAAFNAHIARFLFLFSGDFGLFPFVRLFVTDL